MFQKIGVFGFKENRLRQKTGFLKVGLVEKSFTEDTVQNLQGNARKEILMALIFFFSFNPNTCKK